MQGFQNVILLAFALVLLLCFFKETCCYIYQQHDKKQNKTDWSCGGLCTGPPDVALDSKGKSLEFETEEERHLLLSKTHNRLWFLVHNIIVQSLVFFPLKVRALEVSILLRLLQVFAVNSLRNFHVIIGHCYLFQGPIPEQWTPYGQASLRVSIFSSTDPAPERPSSPEEFVHENDLPEV